MGSEPELEARAKRIIDSNRYMTIATVTDSGSPWATPVYFNPGGYTEMYWISSPDAQHSRNIAARPDVTIVVFDSQVPIGSAEAVYMKGTATMIEEPTAEECAVAFVTRFEPIKSFTPDELSGDAPLRLYRAAVSEHWVLIRGSDPVWGRGIDSRMAVTLR